MFMVPEGSILFSGHQTGSEITGSTWGSKAKCDYCSWKNRTSREILNVFAETMEYRFMQWLEAVMFIQYRRFDRLDGNVGKDGTYCSRSNTKADHRYSQRRAPVCPLTLLIVWCCWYTGKWVEPIENALLVNFWSLRYWLSLYFLKF